MSTWEDRMAVRARERAVVTAAERLLLAVDLSAANPPVEGEGEVIAEDGPHLGHRSHRHASHPGFVVCQCGDPGSALYFGGEPGDPSEPCPVCTARGIPQDGCE